jgi:hypothetical protein
MAESQIFLRVFTCGFVKRELHPDSGTCKTGEVDLRSKIEGIMRVRVRDVNRFRFAKN